MTIVKDEVHDKDFVFVLNPLTGTSKLQSNGPSYSNSAMAVDGWVVTFGTARRSLSGLPPSLLASYYSMWHYNYLCPLNGQGVLED